MGMGAGLVGRLVPLLPHPAPKPRLPPRKLPSCPRRGARPAHQTWATVIRPAWRSQFARTDRRRLPDVTAAGRGQEQRPAVLLVIPGLPGGCQDGAELGVLARPWVRPCADDRAWSVAFRRAGLPMWIAYGGGQG